MERGVTRVLRQGGFAIPLLLSQCAPGACAPPPPPPTGCEVSPPAIDPTVEIMPPQHDNPSGGFAVAKGPNPGTVRIGDLPGLTLAEEQEILDDWNCMIGRTILVSDYVTPNVHGIQNDELVEEKNRLAETYVGYYPDGTTEVAVIVLDVEDMQLAAQRFQGSDPEALLYPAKHDMGHAVFNLTDPFRSSNTAELENFPNSLQCDDPTAPRYTDDENMMSQCSQYEGDPNYFTASLAQNLEVHGFVIHRP